MINKFLLTTAVLLGCFGCAGGPLGGPSAQPTGAYGQQAGANDSCTNCATVTEIRVVDSKPAGIGFGSVIGAVIGGYAGSEIGSGSGREAATAIGAAAGGYAGTQAESSVGQFYRITVRKDNGVLEEIYQRTPPDYGVGARVQLRNG